MTNNIAEKVLAWRDCKGKLWDGSRRRLKADIWIITKTY